jgi:predicted transcriptional regulator of viral defense system
MTCSDLPNWYLQRRLPVVDLRSAVWKRARREVIPRGYEPDQCVRRLAKAGRLQRISRGIYTVVDPVHQTPPIAIASALYSESRHYLTTDAVFAFEGLIDQPVRVITVVLAHSRRSIEVAGVLIRPVTVSERFLKEADDFGTSIDGFKLRIATRVQAVVDALAEPRWMTYFDLLPEIIAALKPSEIEQVAAWSKKHSLAAAQRLGYLLESADKPLPAPISDLRPVRSVHLNPTRKRPGLYSTRWKVYG